MKNDLSIRNIASTPSDLYPHLKITNEQFPRLLATRRIEMDDAEYFGAFLPKTSVRILMGFINKVFRLRTCDIEIDGNFPVPCTEYYRKRCLAPCVSNICSKKEYDRAVGLVRLFLDDQRGLLKKAIKQIIDNSSDELDFETAAEWRDTLSEIERYWENPRWSVWLGQAVDTYEIEHTDAELNIFLVTQRGRNVIGRKVFAFRGADPLSPDEALSQIISSFYRFHLPREINIPVDIEDRKKIASELSARFGREAKIILKRTQKRVASGRALRVAHDEKELDRIRPVTSGAEMGRILRDQFSLSRAPKRVAAFDVAHISGRGFVAASSVWKNGKFSKSSYEFHFSGASSELEALAEGVRSALLDDREPRPDLIVLDGGKPQLKAVLKALDIDSEAQGIVAAVKPAGRHSEISRFLLPNGKEVSFDAADPSHSMLQLLRDDAHDLANRVHRDLRDMGHHYELAAILPGFTETERRRLIAHLGSVKKLLTADEAELEKLAGKDKAKQMIAEIKNFNSKESGPVLPFVVPIRYDAEGGNAEDLRPIATR